MNRWLLKLTLSVIVPLISAAAVKPVFAETRQELLVYSGITMIRPMTELAREFEKKAKVRIIIAQGGTEDLYQSIRKSRLGDLYLPGEAGVRSRHAADDLLGDYRVVGYNRLVMMVQKGNPKGIKPELRELLRKDIVLVLGSSESGSVGSESKRILMRAGLYDRAVAKAIQLLPDSRSLVSAMRRKEADLTLNWRAAAFVVTPAVQIDLLELPVSVAPVHELQLTLLKTSKNIEQAKAFMEFAAGPSGQAIFRRYGFEDNGSGR